MFATRLVALFTGLNTALAAVVWDGRFNDYKYAVVPASPPTLLPHPPAHQPSLTPGVGATKLVHTRRTFT